MIALLTRIVVICIDVYGVHPSVPNLAKAVIKSSHVARSTHTVELSAKSTETQMQFRAIYTAQVQDEEKGIIVDDVMMKKDENLSHLRGLAGELFLSMNKVRH